MIQKVKKKRKLSIFADFESQSTFSHDTSMQNSLILVIKLRKKTLGH